MRPRIVDYFNELLGISYGNIFVPSPALTYVIAILLVVVVFVEHGGKGSEQAAPLARKLYEKYFSKANGARDLS